MSEQAVAIPLQLRPRHPWKVQLYLTRQIVQIVGQGECVGSIDRDHVRLGHREHPDGTLILVPILYRVIIVVSTVSSSDRNTSTLTTSSPMCPAGRDIAVLGNRGPYRQQL
ncbi:MAG: hypothetical protein AAGB19_19355 [Cyanobacteria bacterium P01_F01_bin.3]